MKKYLCRMMAIMLAAMMCICTVPAMADENYDATLKETCPGETAYSYGSAYSGETGYSGAGGSEQNESSGSDIGNITDEVLASDAFGVIPGNRIEGGIPAQDTAFGTAYDNFAGNVIDTTSVTGTGSDNDPGNANVSGAGNVNGNANASGAGNANGNVNASGTDNANVNASGTGNANVNVPVTGNVNANAYNTAKDIDINNEPNLNNSPSNVEDTSDKNTLGNIASDVATEDVDINATGNKTPAAAAADADLGAFDDNSPANSASGINSSGENTNPDAHLPDAALQENEENTASGPEGQADTATENTASGTEGQGDASTENTASGTEGQADTATENSASGTEGQADTATENAASGTEGSDNAATEKAASGTEGSDNAASENLASGTEGQGDASTESAFPGTEEQGDASTGNAFPGTEGQVDTATENAAPGTEGSDDTASGGALTASGEDISSEVEIAAESPAKSVTNDAQNNVSTPNGTEDSTGAGTGSGNDTGTGDGAGTGDGTGTGDGAGTGDGTDTGTGDDTPETITDLPVITGITEDTDGYYIMTWTGVENAYQYNIYLYNDDNTDNNGWGWPYNVDGFESSASIPYPQYGENLYCLTVLDENGQEYGLGENTFTFIKVADANNFWCYLSGDAASISINSYDGIFDAEIYRKIDEGEYVLLKSFTKEELEGEDYWTDYEDVLTESGTYTYKYRYIYGDVAGNFSEEQSISFLAKPVIASASGNGRIITVKLADNKDVNHFDLYINDIFQYSTADSSKTIKIDFNNIISMFGGPANPESAAYDVKLIAVNDVCQSQMSDSFSVRVLEKPVLAGSVKTTASQAVITWADDAQASGYIIYKYSSKTKQFKEVGRTGVGQTEYADKSVKANSGYEYKIRVYAQVDGNEYLSGYSDPVTVYTLPSAKSVKAVNKKVAAAKDAIILQKKLKIKSDIVAEGHNEFYNWMKVSPVSDFIDNNGYYNVAYDNGDKVTILRINPDTLKVVKTITIKKKYPLLGGVTCDSAGNYYIAWGRSDEKEKKDKVTFAISKYDKTGKHKKTAKSYGKDSNTRTPFEAGNCSFAFDGNNLICSYARLMYKGQDGVNHQSNAVFIVNSKKMKELSGTGGGLSYRYDKYGQNYTSHSFDERVISLKNGGAAFADLGDAYSRGMCLHIVNSRGVLNKITYYDDYYSYTNTFVPFHFYGDTGNNYINAQLGGIGEVSTGIALVGTSVKSLTKLDGARQLFLQIIDTGSGESIAKGKTRTGTSGGEDAVDKGVIWLTNYKNGDYATNPQMAIADKDRIVVTWQKNSGGNLETYFMIVSASGTVLQKATRIGNTALNAAEELKYFNGYVFWSTAHDKILTVNKLAVKDGAAVPKTGWNKIYGKKYYVTKAGRKVTGWKKIKGKQYYFDSDGIMQTGWQTIDGNKYYFNKSGVMATGKYKIGKKTYSFSADGVLNK